MNQTDFTTLVTALTTPLVGNDPVLGLLPIPAGELKVDVSTTSEGCGSTAVVTQVTQPSRVSWTALYQQCATRVVYPSDFGRCLGVENDAPLPFQHGLAPVTYNGVTGRLDVSRGESIYELHVVQS